MKPTFRTCTSLLVLAVAAAANTASALPMCVSDSAGLTSALATAAASPDPDEIRLKTGGYITGSNPMFAYAGDSALTLSGGWTGAPGQCTKQLGDPGHTVLNGGGNRNALSITRNSAAASVHIHTLSFEYGSRSAGGGCLSLSINTAAGSTSVVRIERTRYYTCNANSGEGGALFALIPSGNLILHSNLFTYNSAWAAPAFAIQQTSGTTLLHNNSVIGNHAGATGSSTVVGGYWAGLVDADLYAANNLFDDNDDGVNLAQPLDFGVGIGGSMNQSTATLTHNHFRAIAPSVDGNALNRFAISANTFGNPGFAANSIARLAPNSPLRDSGNNNPPGALSSLDAVGLPRIQNHIVDRGAIEFDILLVNGFE